VAVGKARYSGPLSLIERGIVGQFGEKRAIF
jgi:hypothetical protein